MSENIVHAPSLTGLAAWRPIETAPRDGTPVLVYWPCVEIDEDGDLTGNVSPESGLVGVSQNTQGGWEEPDCLNAVGHYFDDDFEYGEPTHWMPLPAPPGSAEPSAAAHETAREQYSANTEQVIAELCEALEDAKGTFEHIADYWNRDANENAMKDACWMAINEASDATKIIDEALSKARGAAG